jgi:transcriptional regulator with XRE-family HTH domain
MSTAKSESTPFGELLRAWRGVRHASQLTLALDAEISQRHVSFLESGRAAPSRAMVLRIAAALDLPLRARNDLLGTAGYAPVYPERPLDAAELERARDALGRILAHHEPYPALVLDRSWNIVLRNRAAARILARCIDEAAMVQRSPDGRLNFLRLYFDPCGLRSHIQSWEHTGPSLMARLRREAAAYPGSPSEALLRELLPSVPPLVVPEAGDEALTPTLPLVLAIDDGETLRLFNTLTTFGTPQDVTLQELRIEMSFPADDDSDRLLRRWADQEVPRRIAGE